jgi:hypothetical protein
MTIPLVMDMIKARWIRILTGMHDVLVIDQVMRAMFLHLMYSANVFDTFDPLSLEIMLSTAR